MLQFRAFFLYVQSWGQKNLHPPHHLTGAVSADKLHLCPSPQLWPFSFLKTLCPPPQLCLLRLLGPQEFLGLVVLYPQH